MANNLKAQIEISADASGVEAGISRAKKSINDLGSSANAAGKQASKGFDNVGEGGKRAASKVDQSTRSMINSIQRQIAVMEAGSRTSSKYYETLAAQRGVPVEALRPYLQQLDSVAAKQGLATAAAIGTAKAFDAGAMSAKQMQFAMRNLPAQLTDISVGLATGQRPLMVFLQQGSQIKDLFGGIGPAIKAMAGYVRSLINPLNVAAVAAGGLAFAWQKGADEAVEFNKALILTGGYARVTADQLNSMAAAMDASFTTHSAAAEALTEVAASGKFAGEQIGLVAEAAEKMRLATGKSISDTVKEFAKLAEDPVKGILELNKSYNFLTEATYKQIKALQDQGRETEAQTLAMRTFSDVLNERSEKIVESLGTLERSWRRLKKWAAEAWDAMRGLGRAKTLEELRADLRKLEEQIDNTSRKDPKFLAALEFRRQQLKDQIAAMEKAAEEAERGPGTVDSDKIKEQEEAAKKAAQERERERIRIAQAIQDAEEEAAQMSLEAWKAFSDAENRLMQQRLDDEKRDWQEYYAWIDQQQEDAIREGQELLDAQAKAINKARDAARELGLTMTSAFEDAVLEGKNLRDVIGALAKDMARVFLRQSFTEPFLNWASGAFSGLFRFNAKGGVYDSPSLSQYSNQVHSSPKLFTFAKGAGVFAEAGPEAIMPLHRGPDGKLGVKAVASSGDVVVSITVNADGSARQERGSESQATELGRRIEGAVRRILLQEKRPGGLLAGA